ncbi:MAG: hypothetical protein JWM43_3494 [Acidobacteriaceae bacterium]|nr:hypothetical protein [Acidobacteriaceae bacterium]
MHFKHGRLGNIAAKIFSKFGCIIRESLRVK